MLIARPINADATLNNFSEIFDQSFVPGENRSFAWRLFNDESGLRFVPPSTAVTTATFNNVDGTTLTVTASYIDPGDRSLISVSLTPTQTNNLMSGNLTFSVDILGDGTNLKKGAIFNALRRLDTTAT